MKNQPIPKFHNIRTLAAYYNLSDPFQQTDCSSTESELAELSLSETTVTYSRPANNPTPTLNTPSPNNNHTTPPPENNNNPTTSQPLTQDQAQKPSTQPPATTSTEPTHTNNNRSNNTNTQPSPNPTQPTVAPTTNTTMNPDDILGKRKRHTNEERATIAKAFKTACEQQALTPGAPEIVKTTFLTNYNNNNPHIQPFKIHAFNNAINTKWPTNTITLDPYGKTNHNRPTLFKLTAQSIRASIAKRDNMDIRYSEQDITNLAVRIHDQITLNPGICPDYHNDSAPIKHCFGTYFAKQYPTLLRYDAPNVKRAKEITDTLTKAQQQHPTLCQTLAVSCFPHKGYGLTTTKLIKKGTVIDTYRGEQYTELVDPHLVDLSYVYKSQGTYIDVSHPYSCFGRYANESFGIVKDNAKLDHTTDPPNINIIATKTIQAWEEITLPYGPDYWYDYYRTYTLPPLLYNDIRSAYGGYYRNTTLETHPNYIPPNVNHQPQQTHVMYNPDGPISHPKRYHHFGDSETESASDTQSDTDSTSTYEDRG